MENYEIHIIDNSNPEELINRFVDVGTMRTTIEINDWHLNQSVLDHTLTVFHNLRNVLDPVNSFLKRNLNDFTPISQYFKKTINDDFNRFNGLLIAGLLHDLGKPSTITTLNGVTSCPNHQKNSIEIIKRTVGLNHHNNYWNYIIKIIEYHHLPDTFIDFIGQEEFESNKKAFCSRVDPFIIDTLLFYLADFEGCIVTNAILLKKEKIYRVVIDIINNCLDAQQKA